MKQIMASRFLVVPCVVGVALWSMSTTSMAQKASVAGGYSASGGLDVDLGGIAKGAGTKTASEAPKGMEQIDQRAKAMQESIKKAVEQFQKANNSTREEKLARLDKVLSTIDSSLTEIGENGPLYAEINKAVKTSEEQQKKYKDKTTDPTLDAKIRERYQKLADKIGKNINDLYERRIVLGKTRTDLEKRKNGLTQEKDFIVDLITADDIGAANEALLQVIDSVKGVAQAIDDFASNIAPDTAAAPTGKATR